MFINIKVFYIDPNDSSLKFKSVNGRDLIVNYFFKKISSRMLWN